MSWAICASCWAALLAAVPAPAPPARHGPWAWQEQLGKIPLFLTFDSHINPADIAAGSQQAPYAAQEVFVWGSSSSRVSSWLGLRPEVVTSFYMPYSRAPSASLGFDLAWFQQHHPDWIMYREDRKTVAFWGTETAPRGSVPIDFTNPKVVDWQMANQSATAASQGYDSMAFDNFGGGARGGDNNGQACGVWQRNGSWKQVFAPVPKGDGALDYAEASVRWIELAKERMKVGPPIRLYLPLPISTSPAFPPATGNRQQAHHCGGRTYQIRRGIQSALPAEAFILPWHAWGRCTRLGLASCPTFASTVRAKGTHSGQTKPPVHIPLRYRLFTPELQWQPSGQWRI